MLPDRAKNTDELDRIRRVYSFYDRSNSERFKRDNRNRGNQRRELEREAALSRILGDRLVEIGKEPVDCSVIDFGCGWGDLLAWFARSGVPEVNLTGIDLLSNRVDAARRKLPNAQIVQDDASTIVLSSRFDFACCFTVFSSILDPAMRADLAGRLVEVLKPNGAVIWYDIRYPNPWNPHTIAMTKRRVRRLFPDFQMRLQAVTLIPQVARIVGKNAHVHRVLNSVPIMRSHYLGLLIGPDSVA